MGKLYFTSDWHVGEASAPNTHSFLRPRPTSVMVHEWLKECNEKIKSDDTLVFVGDLTVELSKENIELLTQLPQCNKILVLGDKEYSNKNFTLHDFMYSDIAKLFNKIDIETTIKVGDIEFYVSHRPLDCLGKKKPAICGHIHGCWRSAEMPGGNLPIINVGIDAWGGLVSEEFILHQHTAISKFYDNNVFPNRW